MGLFWLQMVTVHQTSKCTPKVKHFRAHLEKKGSKVLKDVMAYLGNQGYEEPQGIMDIVLHTLTARSKGSYIGT